MIAIRDLEWAAGFLEGEGSFGQWNAAYPNSISVCGVQADTECLRRLQGLFGGSVYARKSSRSSFAKKQMYNWVIYGSAAAGIMLTLFPLMSAWRKAQMRRSLERWRAIPHRGYTIFQRQQKAAAFKSPEFPKWLHRCDERTRDLGLAILDGLTTEELCARFDLAAERIRQLRTAMSECFQIGVPLKIRPQLRHRSHLRLLSQTGQTLRIAAGVP